MLKGNNFLHDDDNERSERLVLLSANIDTHAVEIGVSGSLLTWAQGASDNWEDLRENALVQDGEMDEAYQHVQEKYAEAADLYAEAKGLLLAIIDRVQKNDDIRNRYGVEGEAPRTFGDLHEAIGQWKKTHDVLVAALDERVVSDTIVTNMVTLAGEMYDLMQTAITEKDEKSDAFTAKQTAFSIDTDDLRLVYHLARMTWGKDDSNLRLLGFVPASEVWTEGSGGEQPENWDDILTGFTVKEGPPGDVNVSVNLHPDADGIRIYVAEGPLGDDNQPEKPQEPVEPQVPQPYFLPISEGVRSWIWICAVKDGVEGPISGPLWVEPTL